MRRKQVGLIYYECESTRGKQIDQKGVTSNLHWYKNKGEREGEAFSLLLVLS